MFAISKINLGLVFILFFVSILIVGEVGFLWGIQRMKNNVTECIDPALNAVKPTPPPNAVSQNICPVLASYRVDDNHKLKLFLEETGYARNVQYNIIRKGKDGGDIKVDIRFELIDKDGNVLIRYNLIKGSYILTQYIDGVKRTITDTKKLKEGMMLKLNTIEDIRTVSGKREEIIPIEVELRP